MRLRTAYIPTQKEIPADAVIPSHRLMLRAGLIRLLAAGIYSYLPIGWKIMKKAMTIIREEMDRIGGQELYLPVLNPVEIWNESGRNSDFGDNMFRLKDRKDRVLVMAPTHEEVVSDLARKYIRSYKDLPQIWYQIQTKFRDEPRPRSGVIRTRQFWMKDSYTLDVDATAMAKGYEYHADAYKAIFTRCRIEFHRVGASSGLMGGRCSEEFIVESEFGEDTLVLCSGCGYAANMEVATSTPEVIDSESGELTKIHTPGQKTIDEVSKFLKIPAYRLMKSLLYMAGDEPLMVLIRGNHELNEAKLQLAAGGPVRPALPEEVEAICDAGVGFVGPIGLKKQVRVIADKALEGQHNLTAGANEEEYHLSGIELDRDVQPSEFLDVRLILADEKCIECGETLRIVNAVELGHIFQLGTKYAESMKVTYLDENGEEQPVYMGSYGIGVERILAAAIEQNHDDKGIVWDPVLAPYDVHLLPINIEDEKINNMAEKLYDLFKDKGLDVLIDDRNASAGVKFKDADLMGIPLQVILGSRWLKDGKIEVKTRRTGESLSVEEGHLIETIRSLLDSL